MNPRVPSSKKWTSLPTEFCTQIREVFEESFEEAARSGQIIVEGRIYPQELLFRVGYLESGRLKQANFEVSIDFNASKQNAVQQIHLAVDCAASMMQSFFEADQSLEEFPVVWTPQAIEKNTVFVMVSTANSQLESEADRLLSEALNGLVQGQDDEEDHKAVVTMLGLGSEKDHDAESDEADSNEDGDDTKMDG